MKVLNFPWENLFCWNIFLEGCANCSVKIETYNCNSNVLACQLAELCSEREVERVVLTRTELVLASLLSPHLYRGYRGYTNYYYYTTTNTSHFDTSIEPSNKILLIILLHNNRTGLEACLIPSRSSIRLPLWRSKWTLFNLCDMKIIRIKIFLENLLFQSSNNSYLV